jgi:lysosomal acid lipase/cholesteryl ester hydrolase
LFNYLPLDRLLNALQKWFRGTDTGSSIDKEFAHLKSTEDFCSFWGFKMETHFVTTTDGYILGLHRLPHPRSNPNSRSKEHPKSSETKPVVLLWHGFLMCSEVFVCSPDPHLSLAFTLAQAGYDVWLGNSRGNKYSCKHRAFKPSMTEFWDFSLDQIAQLDGTFHPQLNV